MGCPGLADPALHKERLMTSGRDSAAYIAGVMQKLGLPPEYTLRVHGCAPAALAAWACHDHRVLPAGAAASLRPRHGDKRAVRAHPRLRDLGEARGASSMWPKSPRRLDVLESFNQA